MRSGSSKASSARATPRAPATQRSPVRGRASVKGPKVRSSGTPDFASDLNGLESGAVQIVERLQRAGFEAYWVGGCVRDFLLGRSPGDYDVVTSALPDQIEALFPRTIP